MKILTQHFFGKSVPWVEFYQDRLEVLWVKASILYFLLLILGIPLNLESDVGHKQEGFSEALSEKGFELIPSEKGGLVALNLGLVLLLADVDLIPKKRGYKGDALVAFGTDCIKMILALLTKVVALHVQALIIQVRITGL